MKNKFSDFNEVVLSLKTSNVPFTRYTENYLHYSTLGSLSVIVGLWGRDTCIVAEIIPPLLMISPPLLYGFEFD